MRRCVTSTSGWSATSETGGSHPGHGFVEFAEPADAERAIAAHADQPHGLRVNLARASERAKCVRAFHVANELRIENAQLRRDNAMLTRVELGTADDDRPSAGAFARGSRTEVKKQIAALQGRVGFVVLSKPIVAREGRGREERYFPPRVTLEEGDGSRADFGAPRDIPVAPGPFPTVAEANLAGEVRYVFVTE